MENRKSELEMKTIISWILVLALLVFVILFFSGVREQIIGIFERVFGR